MLVCVVLLLLGVVTDGKFIIGEYKTDSAVIEARTDDGEAVVEERYLRPFTPGGAVRFYLWLTVPVTVGTTINVKKDGDAEGGIALKEDSGPGSNKIDLGDPDKTVIPLSQQAISQLLLPWIIENTGRCYNCSQPRSKRDVEESKTDNDSEDTKERVVTHGTYDVKPGRIDDAELLPHYLNLLWSEVDKTKKPTSVRRLNGFYLKPDTTSHYERPNSYHRPASSSTSGHRPDFNRPTYERPTRPSYERPSDSTYYRPPSVNVPQYDTNRPASLDSQNAKRLQRLEYFFDQLEVDGQTCRERLLCEISKDEATYQPLSNILLEETRYRGSASQLSQDLLGSKDGARLFAFIEASDRGRDSRAQCDVYERRCNREMKDLINMESLRIWQELQKWLTVKVLSLNR